MKRKIEDANGTTLPGRRAGAHSGEPRLVLPEAPPDQAAVRSAISEWLVPCLVEEFFRQREARKQNTEPSSGGVGKCKAS